MKTEFVTASSSKDFPGVFQNTLELHDFINQICIRETGLYNTGMAFHNERIAGNPLTEEEKQWVHTVVNESLAKKRYQVVNEMYDFIPPRLKNVMLFHKHI